MMELSFEYMNKFSSQMQFISALLCGFSLTVLLLLFDKQGSGKIVLHIFRISMLSTGSFLVSIFAMTNVFLMTTEGFPLQVENKDLVFPNLLGGISFLLGIISIAVIIALLGWTRSRATGIFSTTIGVITLILIIMMLST